MRFTPKQYAVTLKEVLENTAPNDTDKILDNFVAVLAENNDLAKFQEISEEFHKLELADKGLKQAEVTSAKPFSKDLEKQILDKLNDLVGSKVELKKEVDENLIGGLVIRMDDQVIDLSTKRSLEELKNELIN